MTHPAAIRNRAAFCPQIHTSPPASDTLRVASWSSGTESSHTFHSQEKTVRLSCGSSPHNRRPSRAGGKPCSTTGHSPATKPRRRRLFPGHLSARHNTAACQPLRSMPSLSPLEPRHGVKLLLLCKLPKGFVQPLERSRRLFSSHSGIAEERSRVLPRQHCYAIA